MNDIQSLLFVCQSNLACSPLAAAIATQRYSHKYLITCSSAGVFAGSGTRKFDRRAAQVAKENGVPFIRNSVQGVTPALLKKSNVVFYLDEESHFHIRALLGEATPGLYMLSEFSEAYRNQPVPDPLQHDIPLEEVFNQISALIDSIEPVLISTPE